MNNDYSLIISVGIVGIVMIYKVIKFGNYI